MAGVTRRPQFSSFYSGDCRRQIDEFLSDHEPLASARSLVAAVLPHAGWRFSGGVAARTLKTLADGSDARHMVILGAVHRSLLRSNTIYPAGEWQTPLGNLEVDAELGREVLLELGDLVEEDARVHDAEHSIEVQLPLVHELFPNVPVLPILVPPDAHPAELGTRLARLLTGRRAVVIATTDLTHYGEVYDFVPAGTGEEAHEWMRENDRRVIDLALRLEAEAIPTEADAHKNACGPGALTAAVAYARTLGTKRGVLVEHTDSYDAEGRSEPFRMAVGYAGIVF